MAAAGWSALLAALVLLAAFLTVMLFGPARCCRDTPLGAGYRLVSETLPQTMWTATQRLVGRRAAAALAKAGNYCMLGRHPLLQVFYLVLMTGGVTVFWTMVRPRVDPGANGVIAVLQMLAPVTITAVYSAFAVASASDPGVIADAAAAKACGRVDPPDHIIFDVRTCRTCQFQKPARSRHCAVCDRCIARADHHCAWINNCVGNRNHRWFLLFLALNAVATLHGAALGGSVLVNQYGRLDVASRVFYRGDALRRPVPWYISALWLAAYETEVAAFTLLCALCALVLVPFTLQQLYSVLVGQTANEAAKWDDLRYDVGSPANQRFRPGDPITDSIVLMDLPVFAWNRACREARARGAPVQPLGEWLAENSANVGTLPRGCALVERPSGPAVHISRLDALCNIYDRGPLRNFMQMCFPAKARAKTD